MCWMKAEHSLGGKILTTRNERRNLLLKLKNIVIINIDR